MASTMSAAAQFAAQPVLLGTCPPAAPGCWAVPAGPVAASMGAAASTPAEEQRNWLIQKRRERQRKQRAKKLALKAMERTSSSSSDGSSTPSTAASTNASFMSNSGGVSRDKAPWCGEPMYVLAPLLGYYYDYDGASGDDSSSEEAVAFALPLQVVAKAAAPLQVSSPSSECTRFDYDYDEIGEDDDVWFAPLEAVEPVHVASQGPLR
eukprot:TRINITY_DN19947_c0_g2_i1.p1 TRINITY_DN19947_c0_g2~~TRINITY_DN19947_c0_g2_i1.p1  ORF type:complete len:208 (-),score=50.05 TRINITY_DN19947_c0_g2_i1:268-891(-)